MKAQYFVSASLLAVFLLVGCLDNPSQASKSDPLKKSVMVSARSIDVIAEPGSVFSWGAEILWVESDETASSISVNAQQLKSEINRQLLNRGYRLSEVAGESDYEMVAGVVLGDSAQGKALFELAQLYPGLIGSAPSLEKGTLLFGLRKPGEGFIWRSAIQAYLAETSAADQQALRLERIISKLLDSLSGR